MEIIKLPLGEIAPEESDCIAIDRTDDGQFQLNTSALGNCSTDEEGAEAESISVIGSEPYPTYEAAEAAGLAIAAEQCVATLYIAREAGVAS